MTQTAAQHITGVERVGQNVRAYCPACGWKGQSHYAILAQFGQLSRSVLDLAGRDGNEHEEMAK